MDRDQEGRIRSLTREEFARLIGELPEHLADMARFSVATGLRQVPCNGRGLMNLRSMCRLPFCRPFQQSVRGAFKLHTLLDLRGSARSFIRVTYSKTHERKVLGYEVVEPGASCLTDRADLDFGDQARNVLATAETISRNQRCPGAF